MGKQHAACPEDVWPRPTSPPWLVAFDALRVQVKSQVLPCAVVRLSVLEAQNLKAEISTMSAAMRCRTTPRHATQCDVMQGQVMSGDGGASERRSRACQVKAETYFKRQPDSHVKVAQKWFDRIRRGG